MNPQIYNWIAIRELDYNHMLNDVQTRLPEEACGIIAGLNGMSSQVYNITNDEHSPSRYRMNPQEQIAAFLEIEALDLEMLAIYHSHPAGPESPSETDLAEFAYPGVIMLIWCPRGEEWICRGYHIEQGTVSEVDLRKTQSE